MDQKPDWQKEFTKKSILDRLHLSVQELSELGIGWLILSFVILYIQGMFYEIISQGTIPDFILIYIFI